MNKYQYCYNNPLLYIDPNGHQGLREWARKAGNAAYQVGKDTVVGGAKELYNAAVGVPNAINTVVDAGLSLTGTDFRFGQLPTAQAATPGEKSAMLGVDAVLIYQAATSIMAGEAASAVNAGRTAGRGAGATEGTGASSRTLQPGPHAGESIPARGPQRNFTRAERTANNASGAESGCHSCGATSPGTKSGNWVLDHQPPNALNPKNGPQRIYPQCLACMRVQGGEVRAATRFANIFK